jgi:hypothetical protein
MTPLTPSEEKEFFGALAHRSVLGSITFCVLHQWNGLIEEEICACDMYWWTSQMLQHRGALTGWGFILEARHRKVSVNINPTLFLTCSSPIFHSASIWTVHVENRAASGAEICSKLL